MLKKLKSAEKVKRGLTDNRPTDSTRLNRNMNVCESAGAVTENVSLNTKDV